LGSGERRCCQQWRSPLRSSQSISPSALLSRPRRGRFGLLRGLQAAPGRLGNTGDHPGHVANAEPTLATVAPQRVSTFGANNYVSLRLRRRVFSVGGCRRDAEWDSLVAELYAAQPGREETTPFRSLAAQRDIYAYAGASRDGEAAAPAHPGASGCDRGMGHAQTPCPASTTRNNRSDRTGTARRDRTGIPPPRCPGRQGPAPPRRPTTTPHRGTQTFPASWTLLACLRPSLPTSPQPYQAIAHRVPSRRELRLGLPTQPPHSKLMHHRSQRHLVTASYQSDCWCSSSRQSLDRPTLRRVKWSGCRPQQRCATVETRHALLSGYG
jgi:hypothetical protein